MSRTHKYILTNKSFAMGNIERSLLFEIEVFAFAFALAYAISFIH